MCPCLRSTRSVQLTLWGDLAVNAEADLVEGMVLLATACRVHDFNGTIAAALVDGVLHLCHLSLSMAVAKLHE